MHHYHIDKASFMGFSMGARFALALTEGLPNKTEELILIAPDGVKPSHLYHLATGPSIMRRILRSLVINPTPFKLLTKVAVTLHLADKGVIKFAETQMNTREKRHLVQWLRQLPDNFPLWVLQFLQSNSSLITLKLMIGL